MRLSIVNPAKNGELRIFNQFTETFSVNDLAAKVQEAGNKLGLNIAIQHIENPRLEEEAHYYKPSHTGLLDLGLSPHYLSDDTLVEMMEHVIRYKDQIRHKQIYRKVKWA